MLGILPPAPVKKIYLYISSAYYFRKKSEKGSWFVFAGLYYGNFAKNKAPTSMIYLASYQFIPWKLQKSYIDDLVESI